MKSIEHCCEMIRHHRMMAEIDINTYLDQIETSRAVGFDENSWSVMRLRLEAKFFRQLADRVDCAREQIAQPELTEPELERI
jgi:hypothetical protein